MAKPGIRRVAFIRAIGPATHKVMGLVDLCEAFSVQGLAEPQSLASTGNIFFTSNASAASCKAKVETAIKSFGLSLDVFIRDAEEMAQVVEACPYKDAAEIRAQHMVAIFFDEEISTAAAFLLEKHEGPERIKIIGRTIYIDYVSGVPGSKILPGVFERRLKLKGTARNWNTVLKSLALLQPA